MSRYTITSTNYKHDKIIYYGAFFSIILIAISIMWANNFDFSPQPYTECKSQMCANPFYNQPCKQALTILFFYKIYTTKDCRITDNNTWLSQEYLSEGVYGHKPKMNFVFTNFGILSAVILTSSILLNHYIHNKKKKVRL